MRKSSTYNIKLANYFSAQPPLFDGEKQKKPNIRKCSEQPWQTLASGNYEKLKSNVEEKDFFNLLLDLFPGDLKYYWLEIQQNTHYTIHNCYRYDQILPKNIKKFSDILLDFGHLQESIDVFLSLSEKELASMSSINHFNLLQKIITKLSRTKEYDKIIKLLDGAIKTYSSRLPFALFGDFTDTILIGKCWALKGQHYRKINQLEVAIKCIESAMKIFEEAKHYSGIAACNRDIGNCYLDRNNNMEAIQYYMKDAQYQRQIDDKNELANALLNIALTKDYPIGQLNEAEGISRSAHNFVLLKKILIEKASYFQKAREIMLLEQTLTELDKYDTIEIDRDVDIYILKGILAIEMKKGENEVMNYFDKARSKAISNKDEFSEQLSLYNMGYYYLETQRFGPAMELFENQISICRRNNNFEWLLNGLINYKDCILNMNSDDLDHLTRVTEEIVAISRKMNKKGELCFQLGILAYIEGINKKNHEKAMKYLNEAHSIAINLNDQKLNVRLSHLRELLQTDNNDSV